MALGQIIREKREQRGFTLDDISKYTGYSKPYISTIETGRVKNPPADELLVKLEKILEFSPGELLYIAHMEKLPADIKETIENSQAENEKLRNLVKKITQKNPQIAQLLDENSPLSAHTEPMDNFQELSTSGKLVPVINNVAAGYPVDYDDLGYPPGCADDYVRCPDMHDPNAFAVRVVGDSMEPKYHQGDIVIFSPNAEVRNGDDCFVRLADPHETTFKQVFFDQQGHIRLQPRNHKYSPLIIPEDKINGLWRALFRYERIS